MTAAQPTGTLQSNRFDPARSKARALKIVHARDNGVLLRELAVAWSVTPERIRQIERQTRVRMRGKCPHRPTRCWKPVCRDVAL